MWAAKKRVKEAGHRVERSMVGWDRVHVERKQKAGTMASRGFTPARSWHVRYTRHYRTKVPPVTQA